MLATEPEVDPPKTRAARFEDQSDYLEGLVSEIQQAINQRRAQEVAHSILERLVQNTALVFAREESLMRAASYSGLETHREQHRALARQLLEFQARLPESNAAIGFELKIFLKAWLAQHVNETDRQFAAFAATMTQDGPSAPDDQKAWWKVW